MRALVTTVAAATLAAPLPAFAQEVAPGDGAEVAAAEVEATLKNPAMQAAIAEGIAAASEALLDVPLAPLARALAEAAGENPDAVDPRMTMRSVSPDAQDVPDKVRDAMPRMMGAMGSMAGGIGAMLPALREMAERMREAMDSASAPSRY